MVPHGVNLMESIIGMMGEEFQVCRLQPQQATKVLRLSIWILPQDFKSGSIVVQQMLLQPLWI